MPVFDPADAHVLLDLDREPGPQRSACPEHHHRIVDAVVAVLLTTTLLGLVAGLI